MGKPPPYVLSIGKKFVRLKIAGTRQKFWNAARQMGGGYRWFPPFHFGVPYETEPDLQGVLANLRDSGFVFLSDSAWDCPARTMEDYVSKAIISPGFTTIEIQDKDHWTLQKNEKRPVVRPFFETKK